MSQDPQVSVVTPTYLRPTEVVDLLNNLTRQSLLPWEVILVDGAPADDSATEQAIESLVDKLPFHVRYVRKTGGTAIQRNAGIELADGNFIAFIDDDVRLKEDFFQVMIETFARDTELRIGGLVGYRIGTHFTIQTAARWKWYKRLRLLTTFEPGRYDRNCGYPINNYLQPPFSGVRSVDFMTTACAIWRREVFDEGIRFHPFFQDYGVLEDAHFSLTAGRKWELLQCGDAHCEELNSPNGRVNRRRIGYKAVVNYYFVFQDIAKPLSLAQKVRFWRYQSFEFVRIVASALRRRRRSDLLEIVGRIEGVVSVLRRPAQFRS